MANYQVELRSHEFGTANLTEAEKRRLFSMKNGRSWGEVKELLESGDVPYFTPNQHDIEDVYNAGAVDGCPVTEHLLEIGNFDPTDLLNLYIARHRAHRMISRLLRETGNTKVLKLWQGEDTRVPGEDRVDYALAGTPSELIERGNPHVGVAKYENFAICQLFRRLTDAEFGIEGPVEGLPKGVKLYPDREVFIDDARVAKSLIDLDARLVSRIIPRMIDNGVTHEQISKLLMDCFLPEPLLIEDNCWDRAQENSMYLGAYLFLEGEDNRRQVGEIFLKGIAAQFNDWSLRKDIKTAK